jgi:hypothetical protein
MSATSLEKARTYWDCHLISKVFGEEAAAQRFLRDHFLHVEAVLKERHPELYAKSEKAG